LALRLPQRLIVALYNFLSPKNKNLTLIIPADCLSRLVHHFRHLVTLYFYDDIMFLAACKRFLKDRFQKLEQLPCFIFRGHYTPNKNLTAKKAKTTTKLIITITITPIPKLIPHILCAVPTHPNFNFSSSCVLLTAI